MFEKYDLIGDFTEYAARHDVAKNSRELAISRSLIMAQLRAYIGRNTPLSDAAFYYNIYPNDKVLQRAVDEIKKQRKN
jgi:carboxyl-terminal processing protease